MPEIVNPDEEPILKEETTEIEDEASSVEVEEILDESGIVMPEDLPADTVLFEGGPTAGDIVAWKEEHGDVYITEISFDHYIIWRTMNRPEYRGLVREMNQLLESGQYPEVEVNMINEEAICRMCVLFPVYTDEEFEKELAGMPSIISQQVLEASGFRPLDTRGL